MLPDAFQQENQDMVTFRYTKATYDIVMTFIPSSDFKELDINAMCSDEDSNIYSITVNIGQFDLAN